jgi:hypothetical protein
MKAKNGSRRGLSVARVSVRGFMVLVLATGAGLGWMVRTARIQREAVAAIKQAGGSVAYDWEWNHGSAVPRSKIWPPKRLVDLLGFDYLGNVTAVRLSLGSTPATDKVLAQVANLHRLQRLDLSSSPVTDAGLAHLKDLTNLVALNLNNTEVTDAGLAHLSGLTNLTQIDLGFTQITDAGLIHLNAMSKLSAVYVTDTPVTDAGVGHLTRLANLSHVDLGFTRVTDAGRNALRRALPSLKVY